MSQSATGDTVVPAEDAVLSPEAPRASEGASSEATNLDPSSSRAQDRSVSAPPSPPNAPESAFWLSRGDQLVLGTLAAIVVALMGVHWARLSGWGMREIEIERLPAAESEYRLDINAATWVEWMQLEEIGETLARRIVEDREANGPFEAVDDLRRVKGIGPKTLEKVRPWLTTSPGLMTARSSQSE